MIPARPLMWSPKCSVVPGRWFWPTLGLIGLLAVAPAQARERKTPELYPELGSIAVKIKTIGPTILSIRPLASAVFFVRSESETSLVQKTEILASDFGDKNQVYLFNVPPGKYAAVGAFTDASPPAPSQSVYFDSATIAATEVTVEPGKIVFMGDMIVKVDIGMSHADPAQNHFGDLVGRGNAFVVDYELSQQMPRGGIKGATPEEIRMAVRARARAPWHFDANVRVEHMTRAGRMEDMRRDREHERAFWKMAANKVFTHEPDWQKLAQEKLDALN